MDLIIIVLSFSWWNYLEAWREAAYKSRWVIQKFKTTRVVLRFDQAVELQTLRPFRFNPHTGRKCLYVVVVICTSPTNSAKLSQRTGSSLASSKMVVNNILPCVNKMLICITNGRRTTQFTKANF